MSVFLSARAVVSATPQDMSTSTVLLVQHEHPESE
jgi:hypothetical protein